MAGGVFREDGIRMGRPGAKLLVAIVALACVLAAGSGAAGPAAKTQPEPAEPPVHHEKPIPAPAPKSKPVTPPPVKADKPAPDKKPATHVTRPAKGDGGSFGEWLADLFSNPQSVEASPTPTQDDATAIPANDLAYDPALDGKRNTPHARAPRRAPFPPRYADGGRPGIFNDLPP